MSANLTTGRVVEHRAGRVVDALRASVAIPGVMPPVRRGEDVLVDGAAINNLPVDIMQAPCPGLVIGSDVGADRFALGRGGRRINIIQVLMHAGMINSAASERAQRELADVLLKPPLANVDLLNWQAFDRAIQAGYDYARAALETLPQLPRLHAPAARREIQLAGGGTGAAHRRHDCRRLTRSGRRSCCARGCRPIRFRRAVLREAEPIQADRLNLAARGRMRDAEAMKLMLAARRESRSRNEPRSGLLGDSPRCSQMTKKASSMRRSPKRLLVVQRLEEGAHLGMPPASAIFDVRLRHGDPARAALDAVRR